MTTGRRHVRATARALAGERVEAARVPADFVELAEAHRVKADAGASEHHAANDRSATVVAERVAGARAEVARGEVVRAERARVDRAKAGSPARASRHVGRHEAGLPELIVVRVVTMSVPGQAATSKIGQKKVAFRAPHASARSGPSAPTAFVTPDARGATTRDRVSAHRRLDRGDRRCHVQREE